MNKIILFIFFIFTDQISKLIILKKFHQNESIPIINNVFHITLVYNSGSAFGLFRGQNWILSYTSILAIIVILGLFAHRPKFNSLFYLRLWQFALLFIISGATGNLIDRIRLGYVVDFLDFCVWPVFNLADTMITCGVILLLIIFFKE